MWLRLAADCVVLVHFGFILFVVLGGFLAWRWPAVIWVHVPAVIWGALIEFAGWICPLTPLENRLRVAAGQTAYAGGFIEEYLIPVIYPTQLSRSIQIGLGMAVVVINVAVYAVVLMGRQKKKSGTRSPHR